MKKHGKRSRLIKIILAAITILIALIAVLFLLEYYPDITGWVSKESHLYPVEDRCALMLNRLIHQIKDEGECRIACRNECEVRSESFDSSEFTAKENSCNICNCYCKP